MSILVDSNTRLIVQGITGKEGSFHTRQMLEYGTKVIAGVTPGKGGQKVEEVPVYNTVKEAVRDRPANATVIFVPAKFAPDAVYGAVDAGISLIVCITEGIPTLDMVKACYYAKLKGSRLIGPNCAGVISPGKTKVGIMPGFIHREGKLGIVSRSGTLTYEVVYNLTKNNFGQSTCVSIGGDSVIGSSFIDILGLFEQDSQTRIIVLIGEIGGTDEEEAAKFIHLKMKKPVVALVAGKTAPPGKRMGHAGAIISGGTGRAEEKIKTFQKLSIPVAESPLQVVDLVSSILKYRIKDE
ncbi:MAG: succinate--CoA ligase subunit alpha [Candidatus Aerophobetes bacterium]|nr:succinate--CoA ligase subunit alpha [Candidatus Aerophobetes bacterium]